MTKTRIALAVLVLTVVAHMGLAVAVLASNSVKVNVQGQHFAEDSCAKLRVVDYVGGLAGSTYRCAARP